ncbi:TPA: pyrroline-5-carboxylate reductase [Candidatus Bathyarchaeota archaeon]|nr:pyrroline-5-carboxylate reductase [Candidatus Bathyarchaeota archaeon]
MKIKSLLILNWAFEAYKHEKMGFYAIYFSICKFNNYHLYASVEEESEMIVSVIGAGAIGSAVARSLIESRIDDRVIASRRHVEKIKDLEKIGIQVTNDNRKAAGEADIVIVCVKPKDVEKVIREIRDEIKGKLVISMAAAVSLSFLKRIAPEAKFVRVMPNLAILLRESFSAYSADKDVSRREKTEVEKILKTLGRFAEIDEGMMDTVTALSGCAPGYLAFIMKAIIEACIKEGLPEDIALIASAQSMIGTGRLILEGELSISEIIKKVATPGGVTEEELRKMEKDKLARSIESAIKAGITKSRRISEELNRSVGSS